MKYRAFRKLYKLSVVLMVAFAAVLSVQAQRERTYPCMPKGISPDTVVSASIASSPETSKRVFVKDKLKQMNAMCYRKKLVGGDKRAIKFYRLTGCWGHLPPNAKEIYAKQSTELAELRKKYTVITLTCNPSGVAYP